MARMSDRRMKHSAIQDCVEFEMNHLRGRHVSPRNLKKAYTSAVDRCSERITQTGERRPPRRKFGPGRFV